MPALVSHTGQHMSLLFSLPLQKPESSLPCAPCDRSWQHEEAAAGLAPGVADLLQGHLCGIGCMHGAPADEPTQVGGQAGGKHVQASRSGSVL